MEVNKEIVSHRLFIGGLFDDIAAKDIRDRFGTFGQIRNIEIIQRKDDNGKVIKTFCYVDIDASLSRINKCISLYSKSKWKGNEIKVQSAKESYLTRLEKEWKSRNGKEIATEDVSRTPSKDYEEITRKVAKMRAVVPGTKISDEPNWIIGKYGRPLPIVRLRHRNSKILKFDPSKHCHQLKKLVGASDEVEDRLGDLSWSLEEIDSMGDGKEERRKRRKTEFSDRNVMRKEINLSTEFDTNLKCNENVMKEERVDERKLSKIDRSLLSINNSRLDESNEEVLTQLSSIESTRMSQRELDSDLEKTREILTFKNAFDKITDFSSKDIKMSDTVIEKDSIMEDIGSLDEFGLSQTARQIELNEETRSNERCLGESIVTQITRMRTKSYSSDGNLTLQNDIQSSIVEENSMKTEPISNQNVNVESDISDSEDKDLPEYINQGSRSSESKSEKDESDDEEIFRGNDDEIFVGQQESCNIKEMLSEDSNNTMGKSRTSKNSIYSMDHEGSTNQPEMLSIGTVGRVSLHRSHSLYGTTSVKVNNETEKKEGVLSNGKLNVTQSRLEASNRKKRQSEEKRLHSLSQRKKTEHSQRNLVNLALKSENLNSKGSKHIQFGSSDEDDDDTDNVVHENTNEKKVTGTAALSWLGLDDSAHPDDRDDDDDENDDNKRFEIKKQFEGLKGAELFKLHKKAALDERFKIDARFLDSGSEDENDDTDDGVQMNVDHELGVEKSRALSILDDLLGKASKAVQKNAAKDKTINDVIRYDPLDAMHAEYENVQEHNETEADTIERSTNEQKAASDKPYPEVAKETYYSVSKNLKGLFATPESNSFSFLSGDVNSNTKSMHTFLGDATTLEVKRHDTSLQKFDDESGDEELPDEENHAKMDESIDKSGQNVDTLFFFSEDDPRLKSSAVDCPSGFMRRESVDELYRQLEANRERLRQDFKRKHKDAIRRQRKKESVKNKTEI